jgi:hypothetical protein
MPGQSIDPSRFRAIKSSKACSKALMNPFRGILMIIAAAIAFWRGWQIHSGRYAWMAYGLAVVALALAAWHFMSANRRRL